MKDKNNTKEQLIQELKKLRQQIAELKRAEAKLKETGKELQESKDLYKTLIKTSPDSIVIQDLEGKVIEISQGTIDLLRLDNADDLIGKDGFIVVPPEEKPKAYRAMQKLLNGGIIKNLELIFVRKDGTRFIGESYGSLIKDSYGKPKAYISTTRDITERKRAEEILLKSKEKLKKEVKSLRRQIQQNRKYPEIIGNSPKILELIDFVEQVARTNSIVFVNGETGSGKDLIAKAIHYNSPRKDRPFLAINCAALPDQLIESELFGYVKGAFTGAIYDKKGLFEEAHNGTIFLNEVGDIPLRLQGKLLDAIENRQIRRLGQSKSIAVNVRIIAATNKDLKDAVRKNRFREDLYYRLNVLPIEIPPLRERKEDIPLLLNHFLNKYCILMNKKVEEISPELIDLLCTYPFPGNVRELENIIQRSIIMIKGSKLLPENLPKELRGLEPMTKPEKLAEMEKEMIIAAIHKCNGNMTKAAKMLGIHRGSLWRKRKKMGI